MASKYIGDLMFSTGEYTNKEGETKKSWTKAGAVFKNENNRVSIKFEAIPVDPEWSGWMSIFESKPKEQQRDVSPQDVSGEPISLKNIPF